MLKLVLTYMKLYHRNPTLKFVPGLYLTGGAGDRRHEGADQDQLQPQPAP